MPSPILKLISHFAILKAMVSRQDALTVAKGVEVDGLG